MKIERVASRFSVTALAALAGVHVAWGLGSSWPLPDREAFSDAVIRRPEAPGAVACHSVACALGAGALLVGGRPKQYPALSRLGGRWCGGRAGCAWPGRVSGRTDLLSPGSASARFRRLDRLVYSPLCLVLGASSAIATVRRHR
ncbi:DUF3995 domain-containing protein [Streptomyces longwoodensis]|uniref:DUF3995 domain-containing protein n=1 Tax=Streptomyces longwoodensis TaxID=68231 RepID=UPI00352FD961